ncbi:MAG: hypothetical protein K1X75_10020 [Leptospirales bacterium]|nr:hypothetical protein [Leptospirales bacterium]
MQAPWNLRRMTTLMALVISTLSGLWAQAQPTSPPPTNINPQTQNPSPVQLAGSSQNQNVAPAQVQDELRACRNRSSQPVNPTDRPMFYSTSWGNNPQEGQYRNEMERLLTSEINNVKRAIEDVARKHVELIRLYPQFEAYQEIVLEDNPGSWRDGTFVNSKKLIIFHYTQDKKLDCVVLDSLTRSVYNPNLWTRKLMRLYYPNVQSVELETLRHNYREPGTLDRTSPEIQLKALRFIFLNLRTALYSMDMMIAAYYDRRNQFNEWQIGL